MLILTHLAAFLAGAATIILLARTVAARELAQGAAAAQMGLKTSVIAGIIKSPGVLLPQDLAAKLTTWLSEETPADSSFIPHPSSLPQETPIPAHPAILPEADTAPANDADLAPTEAEADADPAPSDSSFSVHPSSVPPRLFNSFQFHLPRPSSRDVALLALLDKFPSYFEMHSAGEQAQWFRYFDALARLALAHPDKD